MFINWQGANQIFDPIQIFINLPEDWTSGQIAWISVLHFHSGASHSSAVMRATIKSVHGQVCVCADNLQLLVEPSHQLASGVCTGRVSPSGDKCTQSILIKARQRFHTLHCHKHKHNDNNFIYILPTWLTWRVYGPINYCITNGEPGSIQARSVPITDTSSDTLFRLLLCFALWAWLCHSSKERQTYLFQNRAITWQKRQSYAARWVKCATSLPVGDESKWTSAIAAVMTRVVMLRVTAAWLTIVGHLESLTDCLWWNHLHCTVHSIIDVTYSLFRLTSTLTQ